MADQDDQSLKPDIGPDVQPPLPDPNDAANLLQALKDAKPSWLTDGLGIRGNPVVVTNTKANLEWDDTPVFRRPVIDGPGPDSDPVTTSS